jgi:pseudoazurin
MKKVATVAFAALMLAGLGTAHAETHEVRMLNRGETGAMVFEPAFLKIAPGDTVRFLAVDPGHNAETIKDLIPEGAVPFKGRINEQMEITFQIEGAYAYKCAPHYAMGMVGLIVVGDHPKNLETISAARIPAKAKEHFGTWIKQLSQ